MIGELERMDGVDEAVRAPRETVAPSRTAGEPRAGRPSRRPYRAPRLVAYGCLTDVTRFGGSDIVDSGGGLGQAPG